MGSNSIYPEGWPDARALELLANEYFSAAPGQQNAPSRPIAQQEFGYGAGIQPESPFASSPVPHSVTGSGIAPSAIHQGNAVDIADPQTSLPDPNAQGYGHVPGSTSGSGGASNSSLPVAYSYAEDQYLPFAKENTFQQELHRALASVNVYSPSPQFPFTPQHLSNESAYYFAQTGTSAGVSARPPFNVSLVRNDFPILGEIVNGKQLVWLDNAATTHKPKQVIDRLSHFYTHENSNIHRAAHALAARATDAYEEARQKVQHFIHAASPDEIIFVRGDNRGDQPGSRQLG